MIVYFTLSIICLFLPQILVTPVWVDCLLTTASGLFAGLAWIKEAKLQAKVEVLDRLFHANMREELFWKEEQK